METSGTKTPMRWGAAMLGLPIVALALWHAPDSPVVIDVIHSTSVRTATDWALPTEGLPHVAFTAVFSLTVLVFFAALATVSTMVLRDV